jgi:hypothetical protein
VQEKVESVKEIIDEESIPLVFLKPGAEDNPSEIGLADWGGEQWSEDFPFVVSHVWADGIGNRKENPIHHCQLRKLQSAVNNSYDAEE